jgi:ElaB/YqjD/DUF883 family membrane-anchored ribosome-binding protein
MAEEPEVIQEQMEETRSALADKLGALTGKITGTVETVQETVENTVANISGTVESVQEAVTQTVEAVTETVENVGETAQVAVENVKEAFNIPKQFDRHPWLFVGGSVLLGFVGGKLVLRTLASSERDTFQDRGFFGHTHQQGSYRAAEHMPEYMEQASAPTSRPADYTAQSQEWDRGTESVNGHGGTAQHQESSSWLGSLVQRFLPDLNKVKELALGTLFATARDLVSQNLPPSIKPDVMNLFNDMAEHAGGKPIQGSVLEEGSDQQSGHNAGQQRQTSGQKEVVI